MQMSLHILFIFLSALPVLPSQAGPFIAGAGQSERPGQPVGGQNVMQTCLREVWNNGGGCVTFRSCCARNCPIEYTVKCLEVNGHLRRQCACARNIGRIDTPDATTTVPVNTPQPISHRPSGEQCGRVSASITGHRETLRIVGGTEAVAHSWPWQVSLQLMGEHICGGSLVDAQHVMTAFHCVKDISDPRQYKVVLGMHDLLSPGAPTKVKRISRHPRYNDPKANSNDIAILRLEQPVKFSKTVRPVCLPQSDATVGKECTVTGWGRTRGTGDNEYLQQVTVPLLATAICNDSMHYDGAVDGTMLCAGRTGRDSCQGDSGGPLVCQRDDGTWELQGIVSWGLDCALENKPGVYTRVYALKSWIKQNLN